MHYMLRTWWLNFLDGLGHYIILLGSMAQILMTFRNITTLGYTYAKLRLNNPPKIFCQIAHISQLIAWIPSRLSWTPAVRERGRSLLRPSFHKLFTGTNNQKRTDRFWHLYAVHALGLGIQSLNQPLLRDLHRLQTSIKRGGYRSQWNWGAHQ